MAEGLTRAQIRAAIIAALQSDATVTAIVQSASIYAARTQSLETIALPAISVFVDRSRKALELDDGSQVMVCDTDVVVVFLCKEVSSSVEAPLDFVETIEAAILGSAAIRTLDNLLAISDVDTVTVQVTAGEYDLGGAASTFTLRHMRSY
ncbi:MAG: hypothetical protein A2Y38_03435 [Spirochaetes bacterium GWB1_59_5]|nr:MAG: hypothetical protein A2Y38_03435 [Spirochaetes bacterium GWB1_59_5]